MIRGMTGFGRCEKQDGDLRVTVEMKTVNHRHLDVDLRGARLPADLESELKKLVARRLSRGKCEVSIALDLGEAGAARLVVNEPLIRAHVEALRELSEKLGLPGEVNLDHLAHLPWARAFEIAEGEWSEEVRAHLRAAVEQALDALVLLREQEGREVAADLGARIGALRELLDRVSAGVAELVRGRRERLLERLRELLGEIDLDEQRVAQEAAILADKADISEEITRFTAYLERLEGLLESDGPAGKQLEFTLQESLREANTMGSKARDLDVSSAVIDIKAELERMREQAANVE